MKKTADDVKKEQSLSFMYFNRFLMLRYFTAFMFFYESLLVRNGFGIKKLVGNHSLVFDDRGNCRNDGIDFKTSY